MENHPNLYTYSTKEEVNKWFEDQSKHIPFTTNKRDAFRIVSSISSLLKDGHSYIYPSAERKLKH